MTRTSTEWVKFFEYNRRNLMAIPWDNPYRLNSDEHDAIVSSLQQFQLGESSEGKHLMALASDHATHTANPDYARAIALFIREEQRHAADLGRFMQQENMPCLEKHSVDGVFRWLRRALNLEVAVVVLQTAEIVAMTYYKALHDATQSPVLRAICRQILHDEVQHLRFQNDTLASLRRGRSTLKRWGARLMHRVLFANTLLVVWMGHRKVYHAAEYSFWRFWRANWSRFRHATA